MDNGQSHPLTSIPALQHNIRDNFTEIYPPYMSISETILAVLFRESGQAEQVIDEDGLFVWNWRTGSKILVSFLASISSSRCGFTHVFALRSLELEQCVL